MIDRLVYDAVRHFYPRPPGGGRPEALNPTSFPSIYFYPRPPGGGRLRNQRSHQCKRRDFYPRPPGGGRPMKSTKRGGRRMISIHALRVEGDGSTALPISKKLYFYPRPPGGGRRAPFFALCSICRFLSTPSGWRATTPKSRCSSSLRKISIHALRVEGDLGTAMEKVNIKAISIHALRVEGDSRSSPITRSTRDFYPRPPGGGRRHSAE